MRGSGIGDNLACMGEGALVGSVQCKLVQVACVSVLWFAMNVSLPSRLSRVADDL